MSASLALRPALSLGQHVGRTIRLALPVMLARSGLLVMISVDIFMVGRFGGDELAFYAIASAPQIGVFLLGTGLVTGVLVLTAQRAGAGQQATCGRIWQAGAIQAAVFGGFGAVVLLNGEALLGLLGQSPALIEGGAPVLAQFAPGLPALLLFVATSYFLEGLGRPAPGMIVMILANVANLGLNALFMLGPFDLGAEGAALGTTIARWFMALALVGYVLFMPDAPRFGVRIWRTGATWQAWRDLARLGVPIAASFGMEHGAFLAVVTFAGWLGPTDLAAYQVCLNMVSLIYMLAIGLGTATGVRVGHAVGLTDPIGMRQAGWVGAGLGVVVMLVITPMILLGRNEVAAVYTSDPAVRAIVQDALLLVGMILVCDALQGIMIAVLRAIADIWVPVSIQLACFWLAAVPVSYTLGIRMEMGVAGLLAGLWIGLALASLFLIARFRHVGDVRFAAAPA
ncbi:MATE family efflux transporter [Marinivivus vitaminiproducens]|uniref:MATE family efflux transporter n=1 Tax=Marinivivus vitaminiproducens TaxID=3035935 RepID=UPI00279D1D2F|nr:MATE family efflux transporter [Geminicoccaceae bacterium SCSIO 64248]